MSLPRAYEDLHEPGALGGVAPFAKARRLVISGRKSLETQRLQRIGTVERVASQVR